MLFRSRRYGKVCLERDAALAEVEFYKRGIEAYRTNWKAHEAVEYCEDPLCETNHSEAWADASAAVKAWEREARERGGTR